MQHDYAPKMDASPLVVAGYIRRSSHMQKENFSVDAQKRCIAEKCQQRAFPTPLFYIDDELSARGEHIEKRPAFKQLLEDVAAGKVHVVIVHSFDRWSRNVMVTLQSFRVLADAHAAFLSLSEHIDYSTPEGRLQLTILAAFAAYFSDLLALHTKKGKHERAAQGLWNGDLSYGYRTPGSKSPPEPDPGEFPGLRLAGELRMQGVSWTRIAEQLNEAGYRMHSKRAKQRLFTADTVRVLLQNEFYAAYEEGDDRGTIVSHGQRYRGQHQAAFTREEWARIQQASATPVRAQGGSRKEVGTSAVVPAFANTLVCAHCEQRLGLRTGPHHDYYKDVAHARGIACPAGGFLQVRQEVVARQFGKLLQHLPLLSEHAEPQEEALIPERSTPFCEDGGSPEYTEATGGYPLQCTEQQSSEDRERAHQASKTAILAARAQLLDITTAWPTASPERRRAMVTILFEPGGISYDVANEQIVALVPRPPFVPWFRALPEAHLTHTKQGTIILLIPLAAPPSQHGHQEERVVRGSSWWRHRGETLETSRKPPQRRPGPDQPAWKIDPSRWPEVIRRVEQGESLRQVARTYHVSYETIRRVLVTQQTRRLVVTGQG